MMNEYGNEEEEEEEGEYIENFEDIDPSDIQFNQ